MPVAMNRGMTEKYVLREVARPVLTDLSTRARSTLPSPPSTLQTTGGLFTPVQDTLRGEALERTGLYDRKKVASPLDEIPTMDEGVNCAPRRWSDVMTSLCSCTDGRALSRDRY